MGDELEKSFQILRVQSAEGTKRIEANPSDTISQLFEKVFFFYLFMNLHPACKP